MAEQKQMRQIRIESNVGETLTSSAFAILPDELKNDELVNWLWKFSKSEGSEGDYRDNDRTEYYLIKDVIKNLVTENLKFYYAVLFHIGRRLKIAQLAEEKIESALTHDHIQETISANESLSAKRYNPETTAVVLRLMLDDAKRKHAEVADQNLSLWHIWRKEVKEFKDAVFRTTEDYNQSRRDYYGNSTSLLHLPGFLIRESFRNKKLKKRMDALGFQVKVDESFIDLQSMTLLQIASMHEREREQIVYLLREFNISKGLDIDTIRRQREHTLAAIIEGQLMREFGDADPFEAYLPLGRIADNALINLYLKCKLPDSTKFFYAQRWIDRLDKDFSYYDEDQVPVFKTEFSTADFLSYARSADSSIKRHWVEGSGKPFVTPEQRAQNIFEQKWIEPMFIAIRYKQSERKNNWTLPAVNDLIRSTIAQLNEIGYKLALPDQRRLEKLWNWAKGKTYDIQW